MDNKEKGEEWIRGQILLIKHEKTHTSHMIEHKDVQKLFDFVDYMFLVWFKIKVKRHSMVKNPIL